MSVKKNAPDLLVFWQVCLGNLLDLISICIPNRIIVYKKTLISIMSIDKKKLQFS